MTAEVAHSDAPDMLRSALRLHLAAGPLESADGEVLDAATDAVVAVLHMLSLRPVETGLAAAVRHFHDDMWLADSPYASGGHVSERAATARQRIRAEVDECFGESDSEQTLHDAIVWGYLDADAGHLVAQRRMYLSRATYFRVLRRARERLAD